MSARLEDGWVVVDCDAGDLDPVFISAGMPPDWKAAFRDWSDTIRVAKIRPPVSGRVDIWLRVGDVVSKAGRLTLP